MRKAQVLSKVIIGGAQEELSLSELMAEVDAEVQARVEAGEDVNEEVSDIMPERWTTRGECVAQLQMNNAELGTVLSLPQAKQYSKRGTLSAAKKIFKAAPTTDTSIDARYSLSAAKKGAGRVLGWFGGLFSGWGSSGSSTEEVTHPYLPQLHVKMTSIAR